MSGSRPDSFDDFEAVVRAETAALAAAIAAIEASGRGEPIDRIEAGLVRELRGRELFMPPEEINLLARGISDPIWALKHPWTARRLFTAMRSAADPRETAFQEEWDRAVQRLEEALDSMWRVRRAAISSRRTFGGVDIQVRMDPWSRRRVKQLQRIAAPTVVSVVPYDS